MPLNRDLSSIKFESSRYPPFHEAYKESSVPLDFMLTYRFHLLPLPHTGFINKCYKIELVDL